MTARATGPFDVKMNPQSEDKAAGSALGRMSLDKQFRGIMASGAQELALTVVPDSGTGELAGLSGEMAINIVGGKHSYDLDDTLPSPS